MSMPRQPTPCTECPWRVDNVDNPRARFPASRWRILRRTCVGVVGGSIPPQNPVFGCHKGDPRTGTDLACAGGLAVVGGSHIRVRLAVAMGQLPRSALRPGQGWPQLYPDYEAMARAQELQPGDPTDHLPPDWEDHDVTDDPAGARLPLGGGRTCQTSPDGNPGDRPAGPDRAQVG